MVHLYLIPSWFLGYDIGLELVFAIITLIVSIFAFKVYKLSEQRQPKLFSTAFLFISMAYFCKAFLNFLVLSKLNENISVALKIASVSTLNFIGVYFYIILLSIGLVTLAYMTFRVRNAKIYSLLLIIAVMYLFFTSNPLLPYHIISSILLVYIFIHYLFNYIGKKRINTMLVLIAFGLLLFGNIHFMFSVVSQEFSFLNSELYYVIAHFLELVAYLLILTNLILIIKNEHKK